VKKAKDEKLHHQLEKAFSQLSEGTRALAGKRQKPKRNWPKRAAAVGLAGAAAGAAMAAKGSKGSKGSGDAER
jgi:hypothetical protein